MSDLSIISDFLGVICVDDIHEPQLAEYLHELRDLRNRQLKALDVIQQYGGIDGGHHKQWVLDQLLRTLLGEHYDEWVKQYCVGEDGPNTYEWDTGVAP